MARKGVFEVMLFLMLFFIGLVNASEVDPFPYSCNYEDGKSCTLISDSTSGTCRTVVSQTIYGDIEVLSCKKSETNVEIYRQSYPEGIDFNACFGSYCLNRHRGFNSYDPSIFSLENDTLSDIGEEEQSEQNLSGIIWQDELRQSGKKWGSYFFNHDYSGQSKFNFTMKFFRPALENNFKIYPNSNDLHSVNSFYCDGTSFKWSEGYETIISNICKSDYVHELRLEYDLEKLEVLACLDEVCAKSPVKITKDGKKISLTYGRYGENTWHENALISSSNFLKEDSIVSEDKLNSYDEEVVVAFIGDTGHDYYFGLALDVIADPKNNVELIVHSGDLRGPNTPEDIPSFINKLNEHISPEIPIVAVVGNHDDKVWKDYMPYLEQRLENSGVVCEGDFGLNSTCVYKGIRILNMAPGWLGSGYDVSNAARTSLSSAKENWRICTSHLTMSSLQTGNKGDEAGWDWVNTCTKYGGIIQQGHSHLYSRTYSMTDLENKDGIIYENNPKIDLGRTFQFLNSIDSRAGTALYSWPWLRKSYNETQTIAPLICTFNYQNNVSLAKCQLISGHPIHSQNPVLDEFIIENLYAA